MWDDQTKHAFGGALSLTQRLLYLSCDMPDQPC